MSGRQLAVNFCLLKTFERVWMKPLFGACSLWLALSKFKFSVLLILVSTLIILMYLLGNLKNNSWRWRKRKPLCWVKNRPLPLTLRHLLRHFDKSTCPRAFWRNCYLWQCIYSILAEKMPYENWASFLMTSNIKSRRKNGLLAEWNDQNYLKLSCSRLSFTDFAQFRLLPYWEFRSLVPAKL